MAFFNLIARLTMDNSQFVSGMVSSEAIANKASKKIAGFFGKGLMAYAGVSGLKNVLMQIDRAPESFMQMAKDAEALGITINQDVLPELVKMQVLLEHMKTQSKQGFFNALGDMKIGQGFSNLWQFGKRAMLSSMIALSSGFGGNTKTESKWAAILGKAALDEQDSFDVGAAVEARMAQLRKQFADKSSSDQYSPPILTLDRGAFKGGGGLSEIGGFSRYTDNQMVDVEKSQLAELKRISSNTAGLKVNL